MTFKEFEYCMEKLKSVYGSNRYPPQRTALLWNEVQGIPREYLISAVDALIVSKVNAPMPSELLEILRPMISQFAEEKQKADLKAAPSCMSCDNSGVVFSTELGTGHRYAFQCSCPRGAIMCSAYPRLTGVINPRSDNLSTDDVASIGKLKLFLNDPRASLFRKA